MRSAGSTAVEAATGPYVERWRQLVCGVFCMVMIANLQYGWTLFVHPIDQKFHWGTTAIQVAFSIFIAAETWLDVDSMKLIMERVICWRIPRLWLIERGAASWQDGGKRSRWR